jgi:hypothetical protein
VNLALLCITAHIELSCLPRVAGMKCWLAAHIGGYRAITLTRNHYGVRLICMSVSEPSADYLLVPPRVRMRVPMRGTTSYGHQAVRGLGAGPQSDRRPEPWMASGLRAARALRDRYSSIDVPDSVSESHSAVRPFPSRRQAL